jgi:hypothetical protein
LAEILTSSQCAVAEREAQERKWMFAEREIHGAS